jgi:NodT family efflux transporter outer membrane factor (OMF) lipoprotein
MQLSSVTGIANTYFQIVALRERRALAKATVTNARKLLDVVQARHASGLANPAEVALQRAAAAAAEIRVKELEQQESEALAALAVLSGRIPGALSVAAQQLSDFKEPRVSAGLPAELLTRRPDVYSAEEDLQAAHADLLLARAAFFPSFTLTASGGLQNPAVQAAVITLAGAGPSLAVGGALAQSIFDGGRLRAARDEANAREQEMLARYRAVALAALWDTEVALSAIENLDLQESAQAESVSQSELAFAGAQARYREGAGDFLTVLEAERALFAAREQMSQYRLARLQATVGLCKALGGGWVQRD